MNHRFLIIFLLPFLWLCSCNNTQSEQTKPVVQKDTISSAYQEALRQNMSECDAMERRNKEIAQEVREDESEKEKNVLQWLQGNWEWSGTIDGYRNSCRLGVSDDYAVLATPRGVLDQGKITIDFDDNTIHFGSTYINFDYDNGRLGDFSNGMYYRKIASGSGTRSSNSGSLSSSGGSDSRLMGKFNSLNEEGRKLTDEIGRYYRSGQASPYTIQAVYRLKQIQDEKISLAQEMGDRELESLCRQQKSQTLTALRQMGF